MNISPQLALLHSPISMMGAMRLVETHEVADALIMKSTRKLFGLRR
jgi:hypothetical protein